jgi:hypothetical protein
MHARQKIRLITVAWGDRYIGELFSYTLPAVLAPGNLPALAESFDCEMVIMTEERWFDRLREQPIYQRIGRYCPIELRPLDEFITRPDAYGVALTHALFRGFEELGPTMLDTHLVFFNADFVMADGSLRSIARKIQEDERLILSPSYCVALEDVAPQLAARRGNDGVLAISPRDMAALALRHRHNTIRGKTVNQRLFSMEWIDQFYWLVDEKTLIGHQLPIAVVCMRPTRVLTVMRTFWDYGIISEACPGVKPCVLADSDDFLMIELRKHDTARDQISLGWPTPRQIADNLKTFITRDPISCARHTLVLHSDELPANLGAAIASLDTYVASVLSELPSHLADHINHPIWSYHYPHFQQARRDYLLRHGTLEGTFPPSEPGTSVAASGDTNLMPPATADGATSGRFALNAFARRLHKDVFGIAPALRPSHPRWTDLQPVLRSVATVPSERILVVSSERLPEQWFRNLRATHIVVTEVIGTPVRVDSDPSLQPTLTPAAQTRLVSLATPSPTSLCDAGPGVLRIDGADGLFATIATPREGTPQRIPLRYLELAWGDLANVGVGRRVDSNGSVDAHNASLGHAIDLEDLPLTEEFDLCVSEISTDDLPRMGELVRRLTPRIRSGGSILVFHLTSPATNLHVAESAIVAASQLLDLPCRLRFSGSELSTKAVIDFTAATKNLRTRRPGAIVRGTVQLTRSLLHARRASKLPANVDARAPKVATSFVIEISVIHRAAPGETQR